MSKDLHFEMREQEIAHHLTEVENGNTRALPLYAEVKALKDLYTQAEKQLFPFAIDEAEDYPENTFEEDGVEFTKRNGSTRYSFSHIPEVKELETHLKAVKEKYKQAYLSHQKGLMIASEDGEELILPKISYTKASLQAKKLQHL